MIASDYLSEGAFRVCLVYVRTTRRVVSTTISRIAIQLLTLKVHIQSISLKYELARVMSDKSQRETALALCKEYHLEIHGGSFKPKSRKSGENAEYAERCSLSVGGAS
jgi:hypothetical protein